MTGLVDEVRSRNLGGCLVDQCEKNGCSVSLRDAPTQRLVIDFDEPNPLVRQNQRRCDYLFIADERDNRSWVVPMGFKNSNMKVSRVVSQLNAGAKVAQRLVSGRRAIVFRPVAVARGIHRNQRRELTRTTNQVDFHGRRERIRVLICDDLLVEALRD